MKRVFNILKFIGAYLLITMVTAAGVIFLIPTDNTNANIGNNSNGNITQTEEGNFTTVVNNLMNLNDFVVNADIQTQIENIPLDINLNLNIHSASGFSTIAVQGQLNIKYNQDDYPLNITFIDNTLYISIFDTNLTVTTNSLSQGLTQVFKLLNINFDLSSSFGEFDMGMIASLLQDYTETQTEDGYDIQLSVMGIKVKMLSDKDFNIYNIKVEDAEIQGVKLSANVDLNKSQQQITITAPQDKNYLDLSKITNLLDYVNKIKQSKFIKANLYASYENLSLNSIVSFNFNNGIEFLANISAIKDPINLYCNNNNYYLNIGNLKVKANTNDFSKLLDYVQNTLYPKLKQMNIDELNKIFDTITDTTNKLQEKINNTSLQIKDVINFITNISTDGENLIIQIPDVATLTIIVNQGQIDKINIQRDDFNFVLEIIDITKQEIVFDTNNYIAFENLQPILQAIINSIVNGSSHLRINLTLDNKDYDVDLKVKYQNNDYGLNLSSNIFNKNVDIRLINENIYITIDQVKLKTSINELPQTLDYISQAFNLNISDIENLSNVVSSIALKDLSLDFITSIKVVDNTLEIAGNDYSISLVAQNGCITRVSFKYKDISANAIVLSYGNVQIEDVNSQDYEPLLNAIDYVINAKNILTQQKLSISANLQLFIDTTPITFDLFGNIDLSKLNADLKVIVKYNNNSYLLDLSFVDNVLYINYDSIKLKISVTTIEEILNLLKDILPNYVEIPDVNIDKLLNEFDTSNILQTISKYIPALNKIGYEDNTIQILFDLSSIANEFTKVLNANIFVSENSINISLKDLAYKNILTNLSLNISKTNEDVSAPSDTQNYIDLNNYLNFVKILKNTLKNKYINATLNLKTLGYNIDTNISLDFKDGIKFGISTDSLGSPLDIKLVPTNQQYTLFISFGNLKLNCSISQLKQLYEYLTDNVLPSINELQIKQLQPILQTINDWLDKVNNTNTNINIDLANISDILKNIVFEQNKISLQKGDLSITLNIENDIINNISANYKETELTINVNSNQYQDDFIINQSEYLDFENVYTKINALFDSLITQQLGGQVIVKIDEVYYEVDYALSFANNQLYIRINLDDFYGKTVSIAFANSNLYVQVDDLMLYAKWQERQKIIDYLNKNFATNISLPEINLNNTSLSTINLKDINLNILTNLTATQDSLIISLKDLTITLKNKGTKITNIIIDTKNISADMQVQKYGSEVDLQPVDQEKYVHYSVLTNYFDEINYLIESSKNEQTDQFSITGNAYIYETNFKGTPIYENSSSLEYKNYLKLSIENLNLDTDNNLLGQLAIDLSATGKGSFYTKYLNGLDGELSAYFNSNNANGGLYFNYNKLKVFLSKSSIKDIYNSAKELLPLFIGDQYNQILDLIKFNENNDIYVPIEEIGSVSSTKIDVLKLIEQYAPLLTELSLSKDGVLKIGFDATSLTNLVKEPIILKIYLDNQQKLHLACDSLFLGNYMGLSFDFTVDTMEQFVGTPYDNTNYMDLSDASGLLEALKNTAKDFKEFHITSTINLNIASILNWNVPVDIRLNFTQKDENGKVSPIIYACIGEIPTMIGVNNDVPFETGDTESGSNRMLYIYYKDGYVYFYRHEYVDILFGASKRSFEKTLKVSLQEFMDDALGLILQYGIGLTDTVMGAINDAIEKSKANTSPMDYSNILLAFNFDKNTNGYNLTLNLGEISRNDDLKNIDISIYTTNKDGKLYANKLDVVMNVDVGISIKLQTKGTDEAKSFTLILGDKADVNQALDYISNYKYAVGEEWIASNGKWKQDSGDYSVVFNTNYEGYNIDTQTVHVGNSVTLPTINQLKVVENGKDRDTYQFVGWCLDKDCQGKVYEGQYTVGRGGATFYAKWVLVESIRIVNFYVDGKIVDTQTGLVGSALKDLIIPDKTVIDGNKKYIMSFDYWQDVDGIVVNAIEQESQDIFAVFKIVETYTLRTITYVSNISNTPSSYTNYNGSEFALAQYPNDVVQNVDGWTTTYRFDGWYEDKQFLVKFDSNIVPDKDITLYAKWNIISKVQEFILTLYDNNQVVYSQTLLEGENIVIPNNILIDENTQWYTDAQYTQQTTLPLTMPNTSVNLHIRNQYELTYVYYQIENNNFVEKIVETKLYQGQTFDLPTQNNCELDYYKDGKLSYRRYYTFNGYEQNNIALTNNIMPNQNTYIQSNVSYTDKKYYEIVFNVNLYNPSNFVVGGHWNSSTLTNVPNTEYLLEGQVIQLSQSKYQPTCYGYETRVESLFGKDLKILHKVTSWGTSAWDNGTKANSGFTTFTVGGNNYTINLYGCWEEM